ncbi:MAG: peptide chain release factor N(5)-glutamine methyltransferase [Ruminococcus sp.]|nr:peptide chain release factor N(5)-glutamine methyltransferase [Ruminococcus sp.]
MVVVKDLLRKTKDKFDKAGIENPAFNSLCLVEKAFSVTHQDLIIKPSITADEKKLATFESLVERRLSGEPLQYILGEWEFYGRRLKVGSGVLIPRDDTEVLLRCCLEILKTKPCARILDLCSGSGALAIAVAKETGCEVYAVEKSADALPYLYENIKLNNAEVKVCDGDVFECHREFENGFFDLILSNPPYIKSEEINSLQTEVGFEPRMALDGGEDGYDFYRFIIKEWSAKLKSGGTLAFELGEGQFDTVKALMNEAGYENITPRYDFSNIQRAVTASMPSPEGKVAEQSEVG